ncbi:MAG: hypothetical protein P9L91_05450 [Candidatus Zophobacter franzmannii]|nr:hypothetical protein [Candidatus Zophobacter franzmannii]
MERDLANGEEDNPQTPLKGIICRGIKPAMQVRSTSFQLVSQQDAYGTKCRLSQHLW